jgi:hypothetical protein
MNDPTDGAIEPTRILRPIPPHVTAAVYRDDDDPAGQPWTHLHEGAAAPAELPRTADDGEVLALICYLLRAPEWGSGMLEDIRALVDRTGRNCENYEDDRATWKRH